MRQISVSTGRRKKIYIIQNKVKKKDKGIQEEKRVCDVWYNTRKDKKLPTNKGRIRERDREKG